ncbi:MAG: site-specific integrase, partial [Kiritimatiellia bacterium]|nr:site-specific integrase [Kiritimatiellia bacterium]
MVWDRLKSDKHITAENPWEKIARREQHDEGRRELTIVELRRVCRAAQGDLRVLIAVGIYTGLRLADAATLRWGEVDLVRGIIRRVPSKSRKGRLLTIPIHSTLHAILSKAEPEKPSEYVMPDIARDYESRPTAITGRVQQLFQSCKIKTLRDRKGPCLRRIVDAGYHSLRHAFVSMCAEGHVPLSVVQGLIGHTTAGMTEKYFHLSAGAATAAIESLPAVTGRIKKPATLPAHGGDIREQVRAGLGKMNGKNWRTVKTELLAQLV